MGVLTESEFKALLQQEKKRLGRKLTPEEFWALVESLHSLDK